MKLRIRGNSLRLRLSQSEVRTLADGGVVEEVIRWSPAQQLAYRIETSADGDIRSSFHGQQIVVTLPRSRVTPWADSSEEGLYGEQQAGADLLKIAVEKDYACIDGPAEENIDAFPNPRAQCT